MNNDTKNKPSGINDLYISQRLDRQHLAITLFVYGTLKCGFWNHDHFCRNAIEIKPATAWGRLYALSAGYPALEIPTAHILARGTAQPLADAAAQAHFSNQIANRSELPHPSGDWDLVHGESITFVNPAHDLPPIDRLEGFHYVGPSYYQRILLPVSSNHATAVCWAYVLPGCSARQRLINGIWPA